MKQLAGRVLRSRIFGAVAANAYNQVVQLGIQLLSVPILASHWGLPAYGVWLLLFTIPSYLAMADLGFSSAAATDMTMRVARGDAKGAADTFLALKLVLAGATAAILALATFLVCLALPHATDFAEAATGGAARTTAMVLIGYGLMALVSGVPIAGFRATHGYVLGGFSWVTMLLLEAACALGWVLHGGGLLGAALAYLGVRTLGSIVLTVMLRFHAPELITRDWRASLAHVRPLIRPALGVMALPAAQAITLQGAVGIIGAASGPAAVPLFTTVRTLTRTAIQLTSIVNVATMPAFSVAAAQENEQRKSQLVLLCLLAGAIVLLPAAPLLLGGGEAFVSLWTHGKVHPPFALLLLMTLTMLLNGAWLPLSNYILALNRHGGFSYYYLLVSVACMALSYPLALRFGPAGVAFALMLVDLLMLRRILALGRTERVLDGAALRAEFALGAAYLGIGRRRKLREPRSG